MACQFSQILERELQALGAPGGASGAGSAQSARRSSTLSSASPALPAPLVVDRTEFSPRARTLACSLQQYAQDAERPGRSNPALVAGWNEAGYLYADSRGLNGEMRFTTASGAVVSISALSLSPGSGEVRVEVCRDGVSYTFAMDDFAVLDEVGNEREPASEGELRALPGGAGTGARPASAAAETSASYAPPVSFGQRSRVLSAFRRVEGFTAQA